MNNIMDLIPSGKKNAKCAAQLAAEAGLNERAVRDLIHRARLAGNIICSGNAGYWTSDETGDLMETYRRIKKSAVKQLAALKQIRRRLREAGTDPAELR